MVYDPKLKEEGFKPNGHMSPDSSDAEYTRLIGDLRAAMILIENRQSAIPFSYINCGGTNYWNAVRTFSTNIIDVAKHKGDDDWVRNRVLSILADPQKRKQFPAPIIRQFILYKMFFYDRGMRLAQP